MNKKDQASSYFDEGFSCSQAVLAVFAEDFGMDREIAFRLSTPFGGGIASSGDICGAVSGALMAIGLKYGRIKGDDLESKENAYEKVREFIAEFGKRNGNIDCKDLLGHKIYNPDGTKNPLAEKAADEKCDGLVRSAIEILENIL